MARRSHKMVVWLPSIFVVMTVLIAIQFWWCYDYLRTTASQEVDYKNQTYFDHTLLKIQNADARSLGFVSYHDFRFSPHRTSQIVSPIEIRRSLLLLLSGFFILWITSDSERLGSRTILSLVTTLVIICPLGRQASTYKPREK